MAYGLGTMSARPRRRNQRPAARMRQAATGGIAPGDQPTRPHEGMVQYGQNGQQWGVAKNLQRRNQGQGGVQWDTGWGDTSGTYGGTGNHQLPGQTPPILHRPELPGVPGAPGQQPGGSPGGGVGDPNNIPPALAARMKAAGMRLVQNANGNWRVLSQGMGQGNPEQLALSQLLSNRFGVDRNPFFDPNRAFNRGGDLYGLDTGAGLNNGGSANVAGDNMLNRAREQAGWTPEQAMADQLARTPSWELTPGNPAGSLGATLTDPELYQRSIDAGRANYQVGAGQQPNAQGQSLLNAGTIRTDVPDAAPSYTPQTPQQGARNQQDANAQQVAHTPQAAMAAGRNPEKHQAYWQSVGWTLNPATGEWTQAGGGGQGQGGTPPGQPGPGGVPNHVPPGTTPPINPNVPPAGQPGTQPNGQQPFGVPPPGQQNLPLDATFEGQRRLFEDALQAQLSPLNAQGESIGAQLQLARAREQTNKMFDQQNLREGLNSRGMLNSTVYGDDLGKLATDYLRQDQDLGSQAADAYGNLAAAASGAYGDYYRGMAEYLLQLQNRLESSPYTVTPSIPNQTRIAPRRRRRRRNNR